MTDKELQSLWATDFRLFGGSPNDERSVQGSHNANENCSISMAYSDKHCLNCKKEIQIPDDLEEFKLYNAMPAFNWIDDDQEYVGGICCDCADQLCSSGKGSIGGGGHLVPEFTYM